MEAWFLTAGIAMCLVSLCAIGRNDWVRLGAISRQVEAEVIGHKITRDNDGTSYAAVLRFDAEGRSHEVVDQALSVRPEPPVGTRVTLTYPFGRPDLARIPRPWTWLFVYAVLLFMLGILIAKAMGWLPPTAPDIPG